MGKTGNKKKKLGTPSSADATPSLPPKPGNTTPSLPPKPGSVATKKPIVSSPAAALPGGPVVPDASPSATTTASLKVEHFAAIFLRRAHELKEEGNRRFQSKDYNGAMECYEQALRLTPRNHPDRAVFHSNRAACLMQMKPVQYEAVVRECTLALEVHPRFVRALFRRARALEALGKLDYALQDVQILLQVDGNNLDAIELARRLRTALRNLDAAHQDTHAHLKSVSVPNGLGTPCGGTSPAALGASVVNGSPAAGKGPPKLVLKRKGGKLEQVSPRVPLLEAKPDSLVNADMGQSSLSPSVSPVTEPSKHVCIGKEISLVPSTKGSTYKPNLVQVSAAQLQENRDSPERGTSKNPRKGKRSQSNAKETLPSRPLKLIYDHDIRLARLPTHCKYKDLRELVRKRFPSSKSVLIKYKDTDEDLVTITSTEELRLAEAVMVETSGKKPSAGIEKEQDNSIGEVVNNSSFLVPLRLYVVEVPAEQEPNVDDEEEEDTTTASIDSTSEGDNCEDGVDVTEEDLGAVTDVTENVEQSNDKDGEDNKGKEIEIDDWLLDFAQLFRTHLGVDPDVHIDLHELGMDLCSQALEETVTSEDAQPLFDSAACKFQEVAALAFFNWGNVHMCAARKRIPLDGNTDEAVLREHLQVAYDWAQSQYEQAGLRYEEALRVKSDFYEGVLALGQKSFECAKLRWSVAMTNQVDLTTWDSTETLGLFKDAEEKMNVAVGMWEKLEERRAKEAKDCPHGKDELMKSVASSNKDDPQQLSEAETREQFLVMRFQINLFWGNILFEHSQVEYKLGLPSWKTLLDEAVQKFELAGASPSDIAVVLKNHISNSTCLCEAAKPVAEVSELTPGTENTTKA